ncbi:2-C-methyl-D-erythritol 4-phosphate cytidylyltransferase [Sphingobacterium sp. SGG-5]|uniref:2-C-methyl-D-erythritol 4-phosphate cytidylyltransferase n=1 Tax=Sphingobacterium sp. SGG-5 TaxID=2710881 RepID=UPI0019D23278|nr:2-C-methyl-D-erythritol 4-phosphate cytidylyltransferase [Sphingobacterium sp. SGG-5]
MLHNIVVIAAGGRGHRIESSLPKQYHVLNDRPVLMHTITAFGESADKIIVVIHPEMISLWEEQCKEYDFHIAHELVAGGPTRFESVKNGLNYIKEQYANLLTDHTAIAVHDAARPLVEPRLIQQSFDRCHQGEGNVLGVKSVNSVRIGTPLSSQTVDRNDVWLIQTPQTFPAEILMRAFEQEQQPHFTDEASVVEQMGYNIYILESNHRNLKITYPEDFIIAQMYLNSPC